MMRQQLEVDSLEQSRENELKNSNNEWTKKLKDFEDEYQNVNFFIFRK